MKKILYITLLLLCSLVSAQTLTTGMKLELPELADQHDKVQAISQDTQLLIFAVDKAASDIVKEFLEAKDKNFLQQHQAQYVADISGMPGIITKLFAMPKMKKYPYSVLLVREPHIGQDLPREQGKVTVLSLDSLQVTDIQFVENKTQLGTVFK